MATTPVYTAAVIGAGTAGKLALDALTNSARFTPVAVMDLYPAALEAIKQKYPGVACYTSTQEMYAKHKPDVACIATFPPSHLPMALEAMTQPLKGLVVEKPLCDLTASAEKLLATAKAKKLPLAVPHNLPLVPHGAKIIQRVLAGEIGQVRLIDFQCDKWDIINAGIHWFNFAIALLPSDPVHTVLAACDTSTRTWRDGMQVETAAVTHATTKSGVRIILNSGDYIQTNTPGKGMVFTIFGTAGHIEFYAWGDTYKLFNAAHPQGATFTEPAQGISGHQRLVEKLALQMDANTPDYTQPEAALAAVELVEAAYLSHRHRCQVTLPLTSFTPTAPQTWNPGAPYSGSGGGRDGRKL
jgi:predicted dehydrogenase